MEESLDEELRASVQILIDEKTAAGFSGDEARRLALAELGESSRFFRRYVRSVPVPVVLAGAALIASWLPARRAAGVDPMIALRAE